MRRTLPLLLVTGTVLVGAACGGGSSTSIAGAGSSTSGESVTLRLGYFPNVTHAPAIVGFEQGHFARALGPEVTLEPSTFNAGPEAVGALNAEALDATFIGPNPAINLWSKSGGRAIRIVAGTTSGGAYFVTQPEITTAADLKGKKVATPQLGGTQDVALRSWLLAQGLETDTAGGGDVAVVPQANADTLNAFKTGDIAGAWVPEPWATRLVQEGGGKVFLDERTRWPDGRFVTTHLVVSQAFLRDHPDIVEKLIAGLAASVDAIAADPAAARAATNAGIAEATGRPLPEPVIAASWKNLEFTLDPVASSLAESAADARAVGLLDPVDLKGIYDLTLLNKVLAAAGKPTVDDL